MSSPDVILANTRTAIEDMKRQLVALQDSGEAREIDGTDIAMIPGELWSCRFNSGLFGVDWRLSKQILVDADLDVTVVRPRDG